MSAIIPFIVFYLIFIIAMIKIAKKNKQRSRIMSDDGHFVPHEEDLTCETKQGHRHQSSNEFGARYIVHNEPPSGHIVLNGTVRKIEDCKDL